MKDPIKPSNVIAVLLLILCTLAALDLWRQLAIKNNDFWFLRYINAVKARSDFWKFGFRIEDLDVKLDNQKKHLESIKHHIDSYLAPKFRIDKNTLRSNVHNIAYTRHARITLHDLQQNETDVFQIRCGVDGQILRVGLNDFRTDERDVCQVFTSISTESLGPHAMFELVPLEEEAFALRSVSNGKYIKTVPPPTDNSNGPWKIMVAGSIPGTAETFRLTNEGYLYSPLMGGFFTCASGQKVLGYPGNYGSFNVFQLEHVNSESVTKAYLLSDLSRKVIKIQSDYLETHQISIQERRKDIQKLLSKSNLKSIKILMGIPMTSKGTEMQSISDSPLWSNLFDSFMKSIDWRSSRYIFQFSLGFDRADVMYDTGDAWSELREEFKHRAIYRLTEQGLNESTINNILEHNLMLKLYHFDHLEGAPSQVVSQLMLHGYQDGFDYFYQINDDTILLTPNWPPLLIQALASNPSIPNFGVTGPTDNNNKQIFTHSFVHRTHFEVFGHLFPPYFKNWWSDDWITTVYGSEHTFRLENVEIMHNVESQKTNGFTRYEIDYSAQIELDVELRKGHVKVDEWLKKNSLPRLPLPNICSYAPLVRFIADFVKAK